MPVVSVSLVFDGLDRHGVFVFVDAVDHAVGPPAGDMQSLVRLLERLADTPWLVSDGAGDQLPGRSRYGLGKAGGERAAGRRAQEDGVAVAHAPALPRRAAMMAVISSSVVTSPRASAAAASTRSAHSRVSEDLERLLQRLPLGHGHDNGMRPPIPGEREVIVLTGSPVGKLGQPVLRFADRNDLRGTIMPLWPGYQPRFRPVPMRCSVGAMTAVHQAVMPWLCRGPPPRRSASRPLRAADRITVAVPCSRLLYGVRPRHHSPHLDNDGSRGRSGRRSRL